MPICIILEHKDDANFVKSVVLLSPILVVQVHMVKKCVVTFERDGVFWCVALRGYALFYYRGMIWMKKRSVVSSGIGS